ncbi:hypothetical protein LOY94_006841 [Ophidiomyces ophidiicola]|nr:hypothetical protein LOZ35_006747 [Ophidiomyces ophidiicola]KAI2105998.1 hypothetical protein LOZ42_006718 [Ophidiomyces ophidiicola]KAI2148986.1 hypothetical protein LOZ26_006803 [Ophidiomyces ophidiicola]KAI2274344.1 hypothetical protein LOZ02_006755 [Ophidiomyces ophidiicola]KAI2342160.1 hypothetical protein LOY94_006841 [Ophidiomyces ophidiicola]
MSENFIANVIQTLRKDSHSYTIENLFSDLIDEARGKEQSNILHINGKRNKKNSKHSYKKLSNGKYCQYCKLTSHMTDKCFFLFPDKAPKNWKVQKNKKQNSLNKKQQNSFKKQNKKQEALITSLSDINATSSDNNVVDSTNINLELENNTNNNQQVDLQTEEINMLQNENFYNTYMDEDFHLI